jgi:RNA polymerase sigma-70 factor (ECF subfamily)
VEAVSNQVNWNRGQAMETFTSREDAAALAISQLYTEHGKAILAYAAKLTGDWHAAEDVWQETALRAWRHWDRLSLTPELRRTWLVKVARNIVIDRQRAWSRRPRECGDLLACPGGAAPDDIARLLDWQVVIGVVNQLSPRHREVITQLLLADRTIQQAALAMGVPEGTVRSRYHSALRALRRSFGVAVGTVRPIEPRKPAVRSCAGAAA